MAEIEIPYRQEGDYFILDLTLKQQATLGKYGLMWKQYLKEYRPILFNKLLLSEQLYDHCAEIESAAEDMLDLLVTQLAERNGVTERLKAEDQMEWVRRMNLQDTLAGRREALIKALSVTAVDYTAEGMEKIRDSFQVHGSFWLDVSDLTLTFHCTDSLTVRQQAELEAQMRPLMPVWCRFVLTIENN